MIRNFPDRNKIEKLSGIVFAKNGKMIVNPQDQEWYKNRSMEMPDWTGEDLEKYFSPLVFGAKEKSAEIFTSRGCIYNCSYCSNIATKKILYRNLDDVIKEMRFYIERYNMRNFNILDELLTFKEERVKEFCNRIEKEKLKISWGFQTRANLVKDRSLFKRMHEVGALIANMGFESGNNEILRLNKNLNKDIIKRAVDTLKELGYLIYGGFIIGFPQDTIETVWQTITCPDEFNIDSPGFEIMVPYPKTEVRRIAEKEGGILTNDFSRYSTYDIVYIPPGLRGYNLLAIRQFAFQYFHTRNENRLKKWLNRFIDRKDFNEINAKYVELFSRKETLNFDYLKSLKLSSENEQKLKPVRLPV
jgi:radical SAM superfamily enzyme YgiQ (UPF0313 family)